MAEKPPRVIYAKGTVAARETHACGASEVKVNPFFLFSVMLGGQIRYGSGEGENGTFIAVPGDVIFTQPFTRHAWKVVPTPEHRREPSDVFYCVFSPRPQWRELLDYPPLIKGYARLHIDDPLIQRRVQSSIRALLWLHRSRVRLREALMLNRMEQLLLWCRLAYEGKDENSDPRVRRAEEYIMANLTTPLSAESIAEVCLLSRTRLTDLFTCQMGLTPMQFVQQKRVERAMDLLRSSNQKLEAIATELGYCDSKHFSRRFKQHTGQSPAAYRHQMAISGNRSNEEVGSRRSEVGGRRSEVGGRRSEVGGRKRMTLHPSDL